MRKVGIVLAAIAVLALSMIASGVAYACIGADVQCQTASTTRP